MKVQFIGIKEKDKGFRIVNRRLATEELNQLPTGRYRMTVEKYHKQISNPQLAYYYGVVLPFFHRAALEQGWEFVDVNELDNYLKSMFASKDVLNKHTGEILAVPGLKRNMTTTEMVTFTDAIKDYASEFLGVLIPEPEQQTEMQL